MRGDGIAVLIHKNRKKDPSITVPSICLIDGDSQQKAEAELAIHRLPGESPEAEVFDEVIQGWAKIGGKLAVALYQRYEDDAKVKKACDDVRLTNMDAHLLFAQVGEKLGLIPEQTVVQAFANIYAQLKGVELATFLQEFDTKLPRMGDMDTSDAV